jgi:hypothetical protein
VLEFARSADARALQSDESRMVTGPARHVVARLREMKESAEADELVLVTPGLDRERRVNSFASIAAAWRQAA